MSGCGQLRCRSQHFNCFLLVFIGRWGQLLLTRYHLYHSILMRYEISILFQWVLVFEEVCRLQVIPLAVCCCSSLLLFLDHWYPCFRNFDSLSLLMLSEWSLLSCTFGSFLRSLYGPVPISTDILANLTSPRKRNIKFCLQFSFPMVIPSPLYRRLQK